MEQTTDLHALKHWVNELINARFDYAPVFSFNEITEIVINAPKFKHIPEGVKRLLVIVCTADECYINGVLVNQIERVNSASELN